MSSAVVHIEEYRERKLTEMFMRFTMHHGFKAEFCNPDSPQEKGNVRKQSGILAQKLPASAAESRKPSRLGQAKPTTLGRMHEGFRAGALRQTRKNIGDVQGRAVKPNPTAERTI